MGKRGPKPQFINVACPNKDCKLYGRTDQGNVIWKWNLHKSWKKNEKISLPSLQQSDFRLYSTFYHNLRKDEQTIDLALKMSLEGMNNA